MKAPQSKRIWLDLPPLLGIERRMRTLQRSLCVENFGLILTEINYI